MAIMSSYTRSLLLLLASSFVHAGLDESYGAPPNRTFQLIGDQVCEVFAVVEVPRVYETYCNENKIVTFDDCSETITVTNAPTHIITTYTHRSTLNPCPTETCTEYGCHEETITEYYTVTSCSLDRCHTKTVTEARVKTKTWNGKPTDEPIAYCKDGKSCENHACCGPDYECGYSDEFCTTGCHPDLGSCRDDDEKECGGDLRCKSYECCSQDNKCGYGPEFCGKGCQPEFGKCTEPDRCLDGESCCDGECCSADYYCGKGPDFCGKGCRPDLGECSPPQPTNSPTEPHPRCLNGEHCPIGGCCSEDYYCGYGEHFCGAGCHPDLGFCFESDSESAPEPTDADTGPLHPRCLQGVRCPFRGCCNENYYCGYGPDFCGPGCRPELGTCYNPPPQPTDPINPPPPKCSIGTPCPIGSCCGGNYYCGYDAESCGVGCHPDLGLCFNSGNTPNP